MPASQFFVMLDECMFIQAQHYAQLCDIQAISICNVKYFDEIKIKYTDIILGKKRITIDDLPDEAKEAVRPTFDADSEDAKYAVMRALAMVKQKSGMRL